MKKKSFLSVLLGFVVLSIFAFSVLSKAQQFKPIKPQVLGKTYWCAEVADILYNKEPVQGERFTVGVRVKFTKKTVIPGVPGPKLSSCAFEGPTGSPAKFWSKTMSLRLIGIKYSEKETNLLEYGGPTPPFYPYDYSGFPVIGFVVTENDLKKGYIDVWNWTSKEPLQPRDFDIYVSLAIYPDGGPYDKEHECHFQGDFKKSFSPKVLQVPKLDLNRIKDAIGRVEDTIKMPDLNVVLGLYNQKLGEDARMVEFFGADLGIKVRNIGIAPSPPVDVLVERQWPSGCGYPKETIAKERIKGLKVDEEVVIVVYIDNEGCHPVYDAYFIVTVDPDNKVTELDETNNVSQVKLRGVKADELQPKFKPAPAKAK